MKKSPRTKKSLSKSRKSKIWVCVYDLHWPITHMPTWRAVLQFVKENHDSIEGFLFGGDEFHNEQISHFTKGRPLLRETGSYLDETRTFDAKILKPLEKLLPKHAKKVVITGNHTRFETDWIEENPQFAGIERFKELKLAERGWKVIPLGREYHIGKLCCIHGDGLITGFAPACPAKKAVDVYACSVLMGHCHSPQSFTRVSPVDQEQTWMGYVSAIAGETNAAYQRNRPNAYANGLTIVEVRPNGNFNCYLAITDRNTGEFSYGGRTYSGQ